MRTRARAIWERLRASYWFLPSLMSLLAVGLATSGLALDERIRYTTLREQGWVYSGGPEGARAVLATIAGSIITVAGTTFSITIAVLSMTSGQFGPRLLRNFMRDRANQAVLGTFTATFLYCLLVLRTVRGTDQETYVPHLSVTIGVALAVLCLGVLIYFIHHIAASIQVANVLNKIGCELDDAVTRLFPKSIGEGVRSALVPSGRTCSILASTSGYLQEVDDERLLDLVTRQGAVLWLQTRPGAYVIAGMTLAEMWVSADAADTDVIRSAFTFGLQRTPYQDAEFAFLQVVELAVRALSPGINDPFTAIMCIDRLSAALCLLAERSLPAAHRLDRQGHIRVIVQPYRYEQLVQAAFSQIRENGKSHRIIIERLRQQIDVVLGRAASAEFRMALEHERAQLLDPEAIGQHSEPDAC